METKVITEKGQEIPLEDIEYFAMYHQSGYAGQKILAVIKEELLTKDRWNGKGFVIIKKGKYPFSKFDVQVKNNRKIRKIVYDFLFSEVIKNHHYESKLTSEKLKEMLDNEK